MSIVNLQKMHDLTGTISNFSATKNSNEVILSLDTDSKKKLERILTSGNVTADTQKMYLNKLIISKEDEFFLTEGQSPFVREGNVISLSAQPRSIPHFKAVLQSVAPMKTNNELLYAFEITLQNFSFDLTNSRKTVYDDIVFENVQLIVYPGRHSIRVLED